MKSSDVHCLCGYGVFLRPGLAKGVNKESIEIRRDGAGDRPEKGTEYGQLGTERDRDR